MTSTPDDLISHRLRAPDYRQWRAQVQATGGCAAPIHLHGSSRILDRDGAVLLERTGTVLAPCGNRRATVCPACSDRYAADAYHLLRAGLAGDDTKNVPATVIEHPRVFLTLTAPSFGPVHTRTVTPRGHVIPCRCGDRHHPDDPRIGTALDPDTYDYEGAVLWQAHAGHAVGPVHHRPAPRPGRRARRPRRGVPRARPAVLRQGRRVPTPRAGALPRRHPPRRPRRTGRPTTGRARPRRAAGRHQPCRARPRRSPPTAPTAHRWCSAGAHNWTCGRSPRPPRRRSRTSTGEITDTALAGLHRQVRHQGHRRHRRRRPARSATCATSSYLRVSEHHRRMIVTAWELGGLPQYDGLNLRRWAHMLGFRGHFLTKSHRYSVTFTRPAGATTHLAAARRPRPSSTADTDDPRRRSRPTWTPSP